MREFRILKLPNDIPKEERLDYFNKGLTISVKDILQGVCDSTVIGSVLNVYLDKSNKFQFVISDDMQSILEREDFKEDWLQYRIARTDYMFYENYYEYFKTDHFKFKINHILMQFKGQGVSLIGIDGNIIE